MRVAGVAGVAHGLPRRADRLLEQVWESFVTLVLMGVIDSQDSRHIGDGKGGWIRGGRIRGSQIERSQIERN
jgi:hypothetical protein